MEALTDILGSTFGTVVPFLVVLGVVIFVHEFGHYIVGRWCGIQAETFSMGFFGEAVGWTDKRGTRWRISWVPLGGYVMFKGDASAASTTDYEKIEAMSAEERRHTVSGAPLWARASMVAAGPLANFLLTIVLMAALGLAVGRPSDEPVLAVVAPGSQAAQAGFEPGDRILSVDGAPVESFAEFGRIMTGLKGEEAAVLVERGGGEETVLASFEQPARVGRVSSGSPAAQACLAPGDEITAIDGAPVRSFTDLQQAVTSSDGKTLGVTVKRGDETLDLSLTPQVMELPDPATGAVTRRLLIGVQADFNIGIGAGYERLGPIEAIGFGAGWVWRVVSGTIGYLGALVASDADGSSLSGPLGIAQASGQAAEGGVANFVGFIATVSAAIGLLNLFPIPLLDGGHLLFYGVEAVRGKPLGERSATAVNLIGLAAIVCLIVFATTNDVGRIAAGLSVSC